MSGISSREAVPDSRQLPAQAADGWRPLSRPAAVAQSMSGPTEPTVRGCSSATDSTMISIHAAGDSYPSSSASEQPSQQVGDAISADDRQSLAGASQDDAPPGAVVDDNGQGTAILHKQQPGQADSASTLASDCLQPLCTPGAALVSQASVLGPEQLGCSSCKQPAKPAPTSYGSNSASCLNCHGPDNEGKSGCAITASVADATGSYASADPDVVANLQQSASGASADSCSNGAFQHTKSVMQQASHGPARAVPQRSNAGSSGSHAQVETSLPDTRCSQEKDSPSLLKPSQLQVSAF